MRLYVVHDYDFLGEKHDSIDFSVLMSWTSVETDCDML